MGTPPRPTDPGAEFSNRRKEALALKPDGVVVAEGEDSMYVECSADPLCGKPGGPALDDPKQVEIANPSVPHRTPWISIKRLRKQLTSADSWRREGLGIWDDFETTKLVMPKWHDRTDSTLAPTRPLALGVAVDPDRIWISVGAAWEGDKPHLSAVSVERDDAPLVLRRRLDADREFVISEIARIHSQSKAAVILDRKGPAGSLVRELEAAGVIVTAVGLDDHVVACAGLYDAVEAGAVTHSGEPELNNAVIAAGTRRVGGRWAWDRWNGEISMLEAITLAFWGAAHAGSVYEDRGLVQL
jgi:hypothetical protein